MLRSTSDCSLCLRSGGPAVRNSEMEDNPQEPNLPLEQSTGEQRISKKGDRLAGDDFSNTYLQIYLYSI